MTATPATSELVVPAIVRGGVITDGLVPFGGRGSTPSFRTPDPVALATELPLRNPADLRELHSLPFDEIVGYLVELGQQLTLRANETLREALAHSENWSDLTAPILQATFEQLPDLFTRESILDIAESSIGIPYLEGWVPRSMADGRVAHIRAVGSRTVHIIAGNSPWIAALSIIRNAVARSDAIIKTPSNDPLTAPAIAQAMVSMAPDHPVTRHLSVAYWKGGSPEVEDGLYQPANVEKIIAWGGLASVTHITKYIRPGLEVISLDPKHSATIIGPEAFDSEASILEVAERAAMDIGAMNQLGCVNARVIYTASGLDSTGLARAACLGELIYAQLQDLPEEISTPAKRFDPELAAQISALRSSPDWYRVIGARAGEGAVIVSMLDEPVDFYRSLSGRVANIVPIEHVEDALAHVDASTQTIGVYPESLKTHLRDVLPLYGAQRLVSLGFAASPNLALPQDAIEPLRRMVKWIVDDACDPGAVQPMVTRRKPAAAR